MHQASRKEVPAGISQTGGYISSSELLTLSLSPESSAEKWEDVKS